MRRSYLIISSLCALTLAASAGAQDDADAPDLVFRLASADRPRAVIGITVSSSGGRQDTLGVLVASVIDGGPAQRAGVAEGHRLQSINGVNLRVASADADDREMGRLMTRRLTRELNRTRPGDEVELRVWDGGRTRAVRVRTVDGDSLYRRRERVRASRDGRATLGLSLGSTGSLRDTLGVLVVGVQDSGPAARAGIIEGHRIAEINGTNLRTSREDVGDAWAANSRVQRLIREIRRVEPGSEVTLRVWQDGQYRTIRVTAVRTSDLPRRQGSLFISGDYVDAPPMPPRPAIAPFDVEIIAPDIRHHLERAFEGADETLHELAPRIRRHLDERERWPHGLWLHRYHEM